MKTLFLKLLELLETDKKFRYIGSNIGQLQEEKPSISYPAALIKMNIRDIVEHQIFLREKLATFEITLVFKFFDEANNLKPQQVRERELEYLDTVDIAEKALQGYKNTIFESFSITSITEPEIRKGLKTIVVHGRTSWQEHTPSS